MRKLIPTPQIFEYSEKLTAYVSFSQIVCELEDDEKLTCGL